MSELSIFQDSDLPAVNTTDISKVVASQEYFPRVQLMTSNAKACKSGDFPINNFALIASKDFTDLGKQVDVAVLDVRLKALDTSTDQPISIFEPALDDNDNPTGEFKRIMDDSRVKDSGCLFGPDFLIYIPEKKVYATFFMGTVSSRRESPKLQALVRQAATLMSQFIDTGKYQYYSPKIEACQTELILPTKEEVMSKITQFQQEESTKLGEVASDEEQENTDRAR